MTSSEKTLMPKSCRIDDVGRGARRPESGQVVIALMAASRARDGRMGVSNERFDG